MVHLQPQTSTGFDTKHSEVSLFHTKPNKRQFIIINITQIIFLKIRLNAKNTKQSLLAIKNNKQEKHFFSVYYSFCSFSYYYSFCLLFVFPSQKKIIAIYKVILQCLASEYDQPHSYNNCITKIKRSRLSDPTSVLKQIYVYEIL